MRLVREVAEIYGQRPGFAGTVHLVRRLVGGAGLVGAVDLVGGVLVQQLGGAVIERISANAAESAYAAQKMARIGLVAMAMCRPVAFRAGEAPSLGSLVSGLLKPAAPLGQRKLIRAARSCNFRAAPSRRARHDICCNTRSLETGRAGNAVAPLCHHQSFDHRAGRRSRRQVAPGFRRRQDRSRSASRCPLPAPTRMTPS